MATIIRFIIRIYFFSPHAFISRRDLSRVAPRKGPTSSPFTSSTSAFGSASPQPPPHRRVRVVARGPIVSNRRFKFSNIFRLPAPLCPLDVSSHSPFFSRSLFLSFSQEPSCPRYYRDSPAGGCRSPFRSAKMVRGEECKGG